MLLLRPRPFSNHVSSEREGTREREQNCREKDKFILLDVFCLSLFVVSLDNLSLVLVTQCILPPLGGEMRDEPKECLRSRLVITSNKPFFRVAKCWLGLQVPAIKNAWLQGSKTEQLGLELFDGKKRQK